MNRIILLLTTAIVLTYSAGCKKGTPVVVKQWD